MSYKLLQSYELKQAVDETVYDIVKEITANSKLKPSDIVVLQDTDKYENSEFESYRIGIGTLKSMRATNYHFNNEEFWDNYYGKDIIQYYANRMENISYILNVQPFDGIITAYEVTYTGIRDTAGSVIYRKDKNHCRTVKGCAKMKKKIRVVK